MRNVCHLSAAGGNTHRWGTRLGVWSRPPAQAALFVREGARRRCCVPSRCFLDRQQSCRALPLPLCVPQRVLSGPLADIWQRPFVTNSWAATGSYSNLFDDGVLWNVYEFLSPLPVDYDDKVAGQIARDHRGELEAQLPVPPPPPPLSLSPLLRALCLVCTRLPRALCGGAAYVPSPFLLFSSPCCCAQRVDGRQLPPCRVWRGVRCAHCVSRSNCVTHGCTHTHTAAGSLPDSDSQRKFL